MELTTSFLDELCDDIRHNRLSLPAMPEVAVKVGRYVNDERMDAAQLSKLLSADATLAGRILQIANSPFFRGLNPVDTVQGAISRLGAVCVRNLVNSLVIGQMFDSAALVAVRQQLKLAWQHSTRVAAHSYVIARRYTRLPADEAMLAGLTHNVGVLAVLAKAAKTPALHATESLLAAIDAYHAQAGAVLLEQWSFPEVFQQVVREHEDLLRAPEWGVDLVDVVLVSNLHARLGTSHHLARVPWSGVPAFARLGLTPEASLTAMREARAEVDGLQRLLSQT